MSNPETIINSLRVFCADMVQKANSGHPGAPVALSPLAYVLFTKHLKFNPKNPEWADRDRFVLSNGHACALLYSLLHLTGYEFWSMDVLKSFRQLDSPAAGHPENEYPGIEVTTGPLGQGLSNAVGMAMAEAHLAAQFNRDDAKVVDHFTYVFAGDGCLQEGVTSEACSLAGHLGLAKLIVLYDDNRITIDGGTDLAFSEDVVKRYESYGWHVIEVENGDTDLDAMDKAITEAKNETSRPSLIKIRTTIGYGSSKEGLASAHGSPLGPEDIANMKKKWGLDPEQSFAIPEEALAAWDATERGQKYEDEWKSVFEAYEKSYPELAAEFNRRLAGELPENFESVVPTYTPDMKQDATRNTSGVTLNKLADVMPELFGGSADLNPSCKTYINSDKDFLKGSYGERNVRYGVREHAMAAISNGLSAHGQIIPFCSTFLNFIGYAFGAVILSALSKHQVLYIFTHDSIGLGEDGPTHQPIEKAMLCRATPNMNFYRPADGNEVSGAYLAALKSKDKPSVLSLTRQNVPNLEGSSIEGVAKGGYVLQEGSNPEKLDLVLVGTGSEVHILVDAKKQLEKDLSVRVVSLPCWEHFEEQSLEYRTSVFPAGVPVLSMEAGSSFGWEKYSHMSIGMSTFGASGPIADLYKFFGFTAENAVNKARALLDFYKERPVPDLFNKPQ